MQDWLALSPRYYGRPAAEEIINDPTNPRHYWRWRMAPSIEELLADGDLIATIHHLHLVSGRVAAEDLALSTSHGVAVAPPAAPA
jgi:4-alpha-glucanotransferase